MHRVALSLAAVVAEVKADNRRPCRRVIRPAEVVVYAQNSEHFGFDRRLWRAVPLFNLHRELGEWQAGNRLFRPIGRSDDSGSAHEAAEQNSRASDHDYLAPAIAIACRGGGMARSRSRCSAN